MKKAIYPGSFDPVTYGHLDIIHRASLLVDQLVVGVLVNKSKTPLFSPEERVRMLEEETQEWENVYVDTFDGLTVNFARKWDAHFIVRGLRAVTDFEYELQMYHTNQKMSGDFDTIILPSALEYTYLSSTLAKEVAGFGGDISQFVPPSVEERMKSKFNIQ